MTTVVVRRCVANLEAVVVDVGARTLRELRPDAAGVAAATAGGDPRAVLQCKAIQSTAWVGGIRREVLTS